MTKAFLSISTDPLTLLLIVNVLLLVIGMFLDATTAIPGHRPDRRQTARRGGVGQSISGWWSSST
jgi:hypothetical protein